MYKAALLTFPILMSILILFAQPVLAEGVKKQPVQTAVSSENKDAEAAEEPDQADEASDDAANFQEVTPGDKKASSKPRTVIANMNGDSIKDSGEDEAGN